MLTVEKVVNVSKNIKAELMIITKDQKVTILSAPDRDGFRDIVFDNGRKNRGILYGSWDGKNFKTHYSHQFPMAEVICEPEIKIDYGLVIMVSVPGFPKLNQPFISNEPIISIYIKK